VSWGDVRTVFMAGWRGESMLALVAEAWREERHRRSTPIPAPAPQAAVLKADLIRLDTEGKMARLHRQVQDKVMWKLWSWAWRPLLVLFLFYFFRALITGS
jgi:hypothetical protein